MNTDRMTAAEIEQLGRRLRESREAMRRALDANRIEAANAGVVRGLEPPFAHTDVGERVFEPGEVAIFFNESSPTEFLWSWCNEQIGPHRAVALATGPVVLGCDYKNA
jgi:hypothetical protein